MTVSRAGISSNGLQPRSRVRPVLDFLRPQRGMLNIFDGWKPEGIIRDYLRGLNPQLPNGTVATQWGKKGAEMTEKLLRC